MSTKIRFNKLFTGRSYRNEIEVRKKVGCLTENMFAALEIVASVKE